MLGDDSLNNIQARSLKDLFHRVGRILPDTQELVTVAPHTSVKEAVSVMREHNFSQVPVVTGGQVLGVFSYRSFAEGIMKLPGNERDICGLPVEGFCEDLRFATVSDEMGALLDELELKDAVLIGSEVTLQGVVTAVDALRYFYEVASAYVMLGEIELAIRGLMRASMNDQEIVHAVDRCLRKHYEAKALPLTATLEEMNLSDYISILSFREFWPKFKDAFGGVYSIAQAKLEPLPRLRNDVFHFRRGITVADYDVLRDARDWLFKRIQKLEALRTS